MSTFEDFELQCNVCLNTIVKKESNRKTIAKILWNHSEKNINNANYLCFEIISDYYCSLKINDIFTILRKRKMGWNHPNFENQERKQKEYDDFLMNPPEVQEGVIECHSCGSKKTFSFSKQTRRADESATVFVRCSHCGKTIKM